MFNTENGGFGATGQNVVAVFNVTTGAVTPVSFTDADLNSGNVIMTVPLSAVGVTKGKTFGLAPTRSTNYFSGALTKRCEGMRFTPESPARCRRPSVRQRPAQKLGQLGVTTATLPDTLSSELGLLMMYRRNAGQEADIVAYSLIRRRR